MSEQEPVPPSGAALARAIALYTLARVATVALLGGALLVAGVPLLVALLIALVVSLPLSLMLLRGQRGQINAGLQAAVARRRARRARMRARLRGEDPDTPAPDV